MGAIGIIGHYSKLKDVSFVRTDLSPPQQGDAPSWETSASRLFMGPGGGAFSLGVSDLGTTAGDTGVTGTRLVLAGIGRITLSQSTDAAGGTITISGGTAGAGAFSAGVSNIGNSLGDTGITGTRMVLSGGGVITLSQQTDVDGATVGFSAPPQSAQTQNRFNLTLAGNTAGVLQEVSSGTLTLAGGNNITVSQNGNAITISGADAVTTPQSVQTLGLYADGNTVGQSSSTTRDARSVSLRGDGAVSVGFSGGSIRISAPVQSVQPETQTFVGGVAATDATYTSGTVRLLGLGNVTVRSTTGQGIQISVPAQSVQPETQTFIGGIAGSNTTYSSGTVRITGVGGGVTVSSNTGQRIDISVAAPVAQSVQTQNVHNVTLSGNTAGVLAEISSGTLTLAGGNNITVSQNGNAVTISGPNVGGAQTGISGIIASDATYTSGTVEMTGSGIVTIRSSAGQRVVVDASQSVQSAGLYALGNTVGESSSTTRDARSISIRGDGIVSVGYSNGSLRISASQSVQPETQTFLGGLVASDKTYTSGTVSLSGVGGGITVQSNAGQRIDLSVAAPVAQTDQTLGLYAVQNTTGQSSSTTRDARSLSVAGDGAVSVGYSAGSLRISAPTQSVQPGIQNLVASDATFSSGTVSISGFGAATVNTAANIIRISVPVQTVESQSVGMSNLGNTSGTTGIASGAQVRFLLAGGNNVTLSQSLNGASGTLTISAANQTVQTQNVVDVTLSGNTAGAMALISSGTMTLAGGNNITVSQAGNAVTISGPNVAGAQTGISGIIGSDATYTSGTVQFTGSNMVTVKSSAGQRIVIDATQSVQPGVQNLVASDATFSSGTVSISGFGDVTVNTAANLIRISAPVQTAESQSFGMSNVGNTSGTTGIASGAQLRFVLAGGNNITLSQSLNGASGTITISAPNAVAQTNQTLGMYAVQNTTGQSSSTTMDARTLSIAGDGAVSVGYSAGSLRISAPTQTGTQFSAGISGGNTAGDTGMVAGRLVLAGGANITLSGSTNGVSETVSIVGGGGGGFSAGASNLGNTAGDTGVTGTRLVLVGTNNITLSQTTGAAGATISISGAGGGAGQFSAGVSTGGNTAGATGLTGTQLVLVGTNAISLSQTTGANGGTVSIDAPATSSLVGASGVSISTNGSTISVYHPARTQFYPFNDIPIVTGQQGQATLHIAPLHFPNVQHDRLLLGMQISNATNSSNSITISAWAGIYSRNASSISLISSISTSTNFTGSGTVGSYSLYGGPKWLTIPWTNTITEDDYWFGIVIRTTTGGGAGHTVSQLCVSKFTNSAWSGLLGAGSNATDQYQLGLGVYSASTSGMPASIAFTQIQGSGSMALREPIFHLRSGTV